MLWSIGTCQNKLSADQHQVTISWAQAEIPSRSAVFFLFKLTAAGFRLDRRLKSGRNGAPLLGLPKYIHYHVLRWFASLLCFPAKAGKFLPLKNDQYQVCHFQGKLSYVDHPIIKSSPSSEISEVICVP